MRIRIVRLLSRLSVRGCLCGLLPVAFHGFPTPGDLPLGFAEQSSVVLGMLQMVFRPDTIASKLRISRQCVVLVDDLLGRSAHLAVRPGGIEDPIENATDVVAPVTGLPA